MTSLWLFADHAYGSLGMTSNVCSDKRTRTQHSILKQWLREISSFLAFVLHDFSLTLNVQTGYLSDNNLNSMHLKLGRRSTNTVQWDDYILLFCLCESVFVRVK